MTASARTPQVHLATVDDLLSVAEDRRHHEVLDGELVQKMMGSPQHGLGQAHGMGWLIPRFSRKPNGPARPGGW